MVSFPIVNGTIPHELTAEYKSATLFIHPAVDGTGIIAGGSVRKLFSVSGVKDIIAKQHRAKNKITNLRVALKALSQLKKGNATIIAPVLDDAAEATETSDK